MDKGHRGAPRPRARRLVDHPPTGILHRLQRHAAVVDPVADVVQPLTLVGEVLGDGGRVVDRGEELDVGVGHFEERLLDSVGFDTLAVFHRGAEDFGVPGDGCLEVVHRDRHMVDLGQQGITHAPCLRNKVIRSSPTLARSSGSSMPRPSTGARHSTPILPSCRLWWTWYAASPPCSSGETAESGGSTLPSAMSWLASQASR